MSLERPLESLSDDELRKLPSRPIPSNQEAIPSNRQDADVTVLPIPDRAAHRRRDGGDQRG
jgi:hypothetical protein